MKRLCLALLFPASLLLACRSAAPPPRSIPDFASCPDLAGTFRFADLASSCKVSGHEGELPTYAVTADGKVRGPHNRKEVLPLPLYHWADPGTRLKIETQGCSRLAFSLYDPEPAASPYSTFELDLKDLARQGTLETDASRLRFTGGGNWEVAQIPLFGIWRQREGWSFSRDEQGRLVFFHEFRRISAMFWVIPVPTGEMVTCKLEPAP